MSAAVKEYQDYPAAMQHPHAKPAVLGEMGDRRTGAGGSVGAPAMFPPIVVHTADQEERFAAQGYVRSGNRNPVAFVKAHAAPDPAGQSYVEYPKAVGPYVANNEEEELSLMKRVEREEAERVETERLAAEEAARPKPGAGEGDLYAIAQIVVPTVLSERERALFKELADGSTFNPRGHFEQEIEHGKRAN